MVPASPEPEHTSPAIKQPVVPGALGFVHVPSEAPDAFVQMPPQHSASAPHTSPVWVQNETCAAQLPFLQRCPQHSVLFVHELPAVLQLPFNGVQALLPESPPPQVPLQHSASVVQAWLSEVHSVAPQLPPSHTSVQHSVATAHESPAVLQVPGGLVHTFSAGSQLAEQQSELAAHVAPASSQLAPPVPPEPEPALPALPPAPSEPESFLVVVPSSSSSPPQL
jgi:hypothetical protein